jgi:transcriptional regulator GlxA family with amidase domain
MAIAERYIAECAASTINLGDLAKVAGVSPRTLHEGFRRYRGYSPMQYLRRQRMSAAREELTSPGATTTVTDVALKWGFNHLGRFSGFYARQFGEAPSETLRAARLGHSWSSSGPVRTYAPAGETFAAYAS